MNSASLENFPSPNFYLETFINLNLPDENQRNCQEIMGYLMTSSIQVIVIRYADPKKKIDS